MSRADGEAALEAFSQADSSTRTYGGTVGLAISSRLVEMMGRRLAIPDVTSGRLVAANGSVGYTASPNVGITFQAATLTENEAGIANFQVMRFTSSPPFRMI